MLIQNYTSHAKINLGLQVLNKREDGYHNLHSLFMEIDLADELSFIEASELNPDIIGITNDPIVSSDIIGDPRSLVFDVKATMKGGNSFVKVLAWYDNGHCHAMRILDVIKAYSKLEGFK